MSKRNEDNAERLPVKITWAVLVYRGHIDSGYWDQSGSFGNEHEARGYFAEMCEMYQRVQLIRTETYEMDYGERMV